MNKIIQGDSLTVLKTLESGSVDCCVTSPPYWGLRDYGVECQIGLEKTPEEYVAKIVDVFREVRRVLKKEGTLWLNLGDSYFGSGGEGHTPKDIDAKQHTLRGSTEESLPKRQGFPAKNLVGIPWRVAFALQADGWWLRQDIIWAKPNPMPESVTDRCTKSHDYVFLMTKSAQYYFDNDAIREPHIWKEKDNLELVGKECKTTGDKKADSINWVGRKREERYHEGGRNKRSVWTVAPKPYSGAHFATFPEELIIPMIKAGTSEKGVCPDCGKAWRRIVKKSGGTTGKSWHDHKNDKTQGMSQDHCFGLGSKTDKDGNEYTVKTLGWKEQCDCGSVPIPAIVLDPFSGAGTTCMVAKKLERNYIGIELNEKYIELAEKRIDEECGTLF